MFFIAIAILLIYFNATKKELLESENRFKRLANNAPDILYRIQISPKLSFEYMSPAITKISGYLPEDFYHPETLSKIITDPVKQMEMMQEKLKEVNQNTPVIMRWKSKDGAKIILEHHIVPIFNNRGKITAIEGIARDITERKATELELQDSEEKYRLVIKNAHEGIFILQNGRFQFFNDKILEITGYDKDEFGKTPFTNLIHPDEREWVSDMHAKRLKGEPQPTSYKLRIWDKFERMRWAELNVVTIRLNERPAVLAFFE